MYRNWQAPRMVLLAKLLRTCVRPKAFRKHGVVRGLARRSAPALREKFCLTHVRRNLQYSHPQIPCSILVSGLIVSVYFGICIMQSAGQKISWLIMPAAGMQEPTPSSGSPSTSLLCQLNFAAKRRITQFWLPLEAVQSTVNTLNHLMTPVEKRGCPCRAFLFLYTK